MQFFAVYWIADFGCLPRQIHHAAIKHFLNFCTLLRQRLEKLLISGGERFHLMTDPTRMKCSCLQLFPNILGDELDKEMVPKWSQFSSSAVQFSRESRFSARFGTWPPQ